MQVNEALKGFAEFLRGLRFTDDGFDTAGGFTSFSEENLGRMILSGKEFDGFNRCLDEIAESVAKRESFSRRGIESLLQTSILKARNSEKELRVLPELRIKQAVDWLRAALNAPPKTFFIYMPVVGLDPGCLPLTVGSVTFLPGDKKNVSAIKRPIDSITATLKNSKEDKAALKKHLVAKITNGFRDSIIAELEVKAGDEAIAHDKAIKECRRTVDVINFFSDIFASRAQRACVSLQGEGNQVSRLARRQERNKLIFMFEERADNSRSSIRYKGRQIAGFNSPDHVKGPLTELKLPNLESSRAVG